MILRVQLTGAPLRSKRDFGNGVQGFITYSGIHDCFSAILFEDGAVMWSESFDDFDIATRRLESRAADLKSAEHAK